MNETLIKNWNSRVGKKDIIYVLGDFILGNNYSQYINVAGRLNGNICLIQGDHDSYHRDFITEVTWLKETRYKDIPIILSHWSMRVWRKSHFDSWNLYGHSHGNLEPIGKAWDVGVDCNNFAPLHISEIENIMKERPHNFNYIPPEKRR